MAHSGTAPWPPGIFPGWGGDSTLLLKGVGPSVAQDKWAGREDGTGFVGLTQD